MDPVLSKCKLAEIKARVEAATDGPWTMKRIWDDPADYSVYPVAPAQDYGVFDKKADAEFVAYAREDVPLLLAEIERLQALLDKRTHIMQEALDANIVYRFELEYVLNAEKAEIWQSWSDDESS